MTIFLDPTGLPSYGIALCARCSRKFFLHELSPDPNAHGLMVCAEDLDVLDPYRLPARESEPINLSFVRPDESITLTDAQAGGGSTTTDNTVWQQFFWSGNFWAAGFWAGIGAVVPPVPPPTGYTLWAANLWSGNLWKPGVWK